jgi:hypothetical protein
MEMQNVKLDLIHWLTELKDEKVLNLLKAIKDKKAISTVEEDSSISQLLDQRLQEDPAEYQNAQSSLKKIREAYGL